MNRSHAHGGFESAVEAILDEARNHGSLSRDQVDRCLAAFADSEFEAQLARFVEACGTLPFVVAPLAHDARRGPSLPGGGRISRRYLNELQRFPPMTRQEEVAAGKRLEFALERIAAADFRPPAVRAARRTEWQLLFNEFVERNLHLVVSEVYAYRTYDVPLDDLVQEGNASLMHAVEKFDWRKGVRFRTYVAWWIRQAVERHLASIKGAVRVPHHLQQKLRRLKRQGRLPGGFDHGTSVADVASAFEFEHEHAGRLVESSRTSLSLEQELDGDGDRFRDLLAVPWEPTDSDRNQRLRNRIAHLLDELDERERTVLRLRFGLDGAHAQTLEEIGDVLHLSRERSRQIQQAALGKLRARATQTSLADEV